MSKAWSLFFLILIAPASAPAAPLTADPLQGRFALNGGVYLQPLRGYEGFASSAEAELGTTWKNDSFGIRIMPWAKVNFPDDRAVSNKRAVIFPDAKEAWVEYVADDWDFRAGLQQLAWGTADGINPTDLWNPWDMTDPFNPVKLATPAAKLSFHPLALDRVALDLIFIPRFRANRLPIDLDQDGVRSFSAKDSRWLQNIPTKVRLTGVGNLPVAYELAPSAYPTRWEAGARLRFLRIGGWDFSLSGGESVVKTPQVNFTVKGGLAPDFTVTTRIFPSFYRVRAIGFDAAGSLGAVGLRAEASLRKPTGDTNGAVPSQTAIGVAGADYTVPGELLGANLYLNASYVRKEEKGAARTNFTTGLTDIEPWDSTLLLVAELRWGQRYVIGGRGVESLRNAGYWVRPYLRHTAWDNWAFEANADFFGGSPQGALGQFRDNRRAGLSVVRTW